MFEDIVCTVTKFVRGTVRAIGSVTRRAPWLTAAAILAVFLVW